MKPLISIIMPVYNGEEYIEESVKSILQQSYTNFELIIVNDGSEDGTREKIEKMKDKRIKLINSEKNEGLTAAFLKGYKEGSGEFLLRHDSDDFSAPNRLEIQADFLLKNPEMGMVSCLISCFTRDPLFRKDCIFVERIQNYYISDEDIKKAVLGGFIPVLFPTMMIRRTIMDKVQIEVKNSEFDDHTELMLELMQAAPIQKVNSILYYYRRHQKAYHVINQKKHEESTAKILKSSAVKNHLRYKDFYKVLSTVGESRIKLNEDSPLRVLMLIDALNIGGTETHVLNITKKLIELGIYVVVATSGGPMEDILKSYGIKTINIPIEGDYITNRKKNGMIRLIKGIVDEENINIIHCHLFASMQLASELYRVYKIPYVVTIHGLFYPNDVLYSSCLQASSIIAVSEPVRKMLNRKLGNRIREKIVVIPNGISSDLVKKSETKMDIRRELNIPKGAKILCYCSRLDWNKTNVARVLLFSVAQLVGEINNLHVIVLGDGPGRESIEKEAAIINEMSKREIVHVVGAKVDVIPYFLESNVVIGTARVALEAMMCRKPVIAIGNQGYTGLVVRDNKDMQWHMYFGDHDAQEKPSVLKLKKDIRYLMSSSDRRSRIGQWAYNWAKRMFDIDKVVQDTIKLYKAAVDNK